MTEPEPHKMTKEAKIIASVFGVISLIVLGFWAAAVYTPPSEVYEATPTISTVIETEYIYVSDDTWNPSETEPTFIEYVSNEALSEVEVVDDQGIPHLSVIQAHSDGSYQKLNIYEFYDVLAQTPWSVDYWGILWDLALCESGSSDYEVNANALGDSQFIPRTGPSLGMFQINIRAHPELYRSLDLFAPVDNAIGAYIIWIKAGYSFSPWSCAP